MTDVVPPPASARRVPVASRIAGSVRFRLTATVVLVVGVSLALGGTFLVRWMESTLTNNVQSRSERVLASMADALVQGQVPAELFSSPSELQQRLGSGMTDGPIGSIDDIQQVISTTYFYLDGPAFSRLKVRGVDSQGRLVLFGREGPALPRADQAFEVTRTVPTRWGDLTIHAVSPVTDIDRSVSTIRNALWLTLPLLALAAGVLTWMITGSALAPVAGMTRRVREITSANLDARVPVPHGDDEIGVLGQTLNDMLDRLESSSLRQRQFVSDASHELRSPVASIRTQLEIALRYPDDVDWPAVAQIVLAEDERLEHLVANLLAMARLEEGRHGPRAEIDLDELILAQAPRMTNVSLDLGAVSAGRVWGNSDELTSVVRNLMDNAARHAARRVSVTLRTDGPWVVMSVADDGDGVPPERRDEVFERFARLQEGRERDQGGTGLGLALTKRIVEHHGGEIRVEEGPDGGASFVVCLPSAAWTAGQVGDADRDDADGDDADRDDADRDDAELDGPDRDDGGPGDEITSSLAGGRSDRVAAPSGPPTSEGGAPLGGDQTVPATSGN